MKWLRACPVSVATAVIVLAVSAPAALALPSGFWGVVPQATPTPEQLQRLKQGGVESIRIPLVWNALQSARGSAIEWSAVDSQVRTAAEAGINILPFVYGAPAWAVPTAPVPGTGGTTRAPAHLPVSGAARSGWINLLAQAVARYGPQGTFWAENPTVPRRPIRTWQIWNEENFKYFVVKPNPVEYAKLVKISYSAIKGADPSAKIILGGMFTEPKEGQGGWKKLRPRPAYFASEFLEQMYKSTPGIKAKFSGIALHPYTYFFQRLTPYVEGVRAVMKHYGDAGKGLWITELGWSSEPPTRADQFAKGAAGQAQQLRGAFSLLERNQSRWHLKGVYWFSVDDEVGACNFCDGSGLFANGFKPKKAWYEYVKFAGGTP